MKVRNLTVWVACAALAASATACNGILADIYDTAPDDTSIEVGFNLTLDPDRFVIYLDATNYGEWLYLDFDHRTVESMDIPTTLTAAWDGCSGWTYHEVHGTVYTQLSATQTDPMPEPADWDIAIHHFDVRTNGGSVMMTDYTSIDQLPPLSHIQGEFTPDVWNDRQVITDLAGMLAYHIGYQNAWFNPVLTTWVTMDFSTPPPVYSDTGRVYLLKMADGRMAALQMLNYMSAKGTKGYLTIDLKLYH